MPKRTNSFPRLCRDKATRRALVYADGQRIYFGKFGSSAARQAYDRLIAEWLANGRRIPLQHTQKQPDAPLTVNELDEDDWRLLIACGIASLRPTGPYPVLLLHGEQGSAKSNATRIVRELIDPNDAPLRSEPKEVRDLMIAARNGWVIALDNLSHVQPWLSDVLCRLSTGGGFTTRELYTDSEEVIFDAQRPVVINGIEELAGRGDLLDRAVILYLPAVV